MDNFELEGWDDINQNGGTVGTGINRAIHKLVIAIFNSGSKTSGALNHATTAIEKVENSLTTSIENASKSADKHADALTHATWILAIATGVLALATVALVVVTFMHG